MAINFVEQLPEELALAVLQHLSFEDRARACCVNPTWDKLTREQTFGPPTLELRPKLVADPRFIRWASTRLEGVQTLRIAWETPKVTQQDVFKGLIELLAHMRTLERLEVPHCLSLPAAVLSKLPATLVEASLSVAFDDSCLVDSHAPDGLEYALPASMPHLKGLDMQISCVGVRSYGLVCTPANLPPCLERLSLATKAWGRRVGPSLLLFSPKDLPNLKELRLEATCFICQDGGTSVARFLSSCTKLEACTLRSDRKAVCYAGAIDSMARVPKRKWEPL